jgi:RNA polymerase sigma-70 factor (ECF subfamily)
MPAEDERRLHRAVLHGDERAWQTLYDASFAGLDAYALWRCAGLRDVADDVIQETWLTAVRRIGDFDPKRGRFLGWLRGIAANVVRGRFRQRTPQPLVGDDLPAPVDTTHEDREQAEQIAQALARLPEHYEAVLRAKYLEGASVAAIAADIAKPPAAVESLLTRAREAFRLAFLSEGKESEGLIHERRSAAGPPG